MLDDGAMSKPRSAFLAAALERGFVHQCTDLDALDDRMSAGRVTAYVGYDCTADSLHVGSLLSIMLLRLLQKNGHKPIVLMGGGTTRIGDPSFRDAARPLLDDAEIARNMAGIRKVFTKFIDFGDGTDRCPHGQQRRLARRIALYPAVARRRTTFFGQPNADPGQRALAA